MVPGSLVLLGFAGMIRDMVFIAPQVLNLAAICAIVIRWKVREQILHNAP
jgi:hypothetical protein